MLTQRDHPFNQSTKPLLPPTTTEYITKQQPFSIIHHNKIKRKSQQHNQQQQQQLLNSKVCGFDDFDYITQQYSKFNGTIGYPYGCPPSPTAVITNAEFTFSDNLHATIIDATVAGNTAPLPPSLSCTTAIGKVADVSAVTATGVYSNAGNNIRNQTIDNSYGTVCGNGGRVGDSLSHWNRNEINQYNCGDYDDVENRIASTTGPFIFGVHSKNEHNFLPTEIPATPKKIKDKKSNKKSKSKSIQEKQNLNKKCGSINSSLRLEESYDNNTKVQKSSNKKNQLDKENKKPTGVKCVLVGDGAVGKTNLIFAYLENKFVEDHLPTASDIYNFEVQVNNVPIHVTLCDTAGQDSLDTLRQLSYPDCDVFLVCFSVVKPESFDSIKYKWAPKFTNTMASIILVGTQIDLRTDLRHNARLQAQGRKPVSQSEAWNLATSIGAKYIETSSRLNTCVKDVFDTAIWDALLSVRMPKKTKSLWKRLLCCT